MNIRTRNLVVIGMFGAGLAACGSDNDNAAAPAPPVVVAPPAPRLEDGFGANFGTAFRASPNTDATDPAAGDLIPLDLTKDAVTI